MKKNKGIFILRHLNSLFPFLLPLSKTKFSEYISGIILFYKDLFVYIKKQNRDKSPFNLSFFDTYPIIIDRYDKAGVVLKHYFKQDIWAAKKVYLSKTKIHYDIGSRLDGFISHCLSFCDVVLLDIRKLPLKVNNLTFIKTDCTKMTKIKSSSISSLSSLHAVEHFGLGRYGDKVDPFAYKKAIREMQRIVSPGGNIYFSVPIGRQRLEFNAHRIFDPKTIISEFDKCILKEFSIIDDSDNFIPMADLDNTIKLNYSCGLFHFVKITRSKSYE